MFAVTSSTPTPSAPTEVKILEPALPFAHPPNLAPLPSHQPLTAEQIAALIRREEQRLCWMRDGQFTSHYIRGLIERKTPVWIDAVFPDWVQLPTTTATNNCNANIPDPATMLNAFQVVIERLESDNI